MAENSNSGGGAGNNVDRTAFVTGGSRGLGRGIALKLIDAGYRVAVGYHSGKTAAEEVAGDSERTQAVEVDISNTDSVCQAFGQIKAAFGPIDLLVNNAGIAQEKPFMELTDEEWERMLSVNLLGAVRTIRCALPDMREQGFGRIVNLSSIGGQWGGMNQLHYAASKAALISLTHSIAKLYSSEGITCNAIAPGLIATDMSAAELETEAGRKKIQGIPSGRLGTTEEVGATVAFLVSDGAAYVTGQTLNLNGGMLFS
ncbi:MAG: NAD(P)-dependent dehydrogenase (short-subunit alcohol dehydrogenase family) [Planctomycetota bacterium]|jgi:NAD(P)-dependent dehydrogenase (short-subunit alcohol dehydrogenase family)